MFNSQKNLYKKFLGAKGELIAENFLIKKGYKILQKNYRQKFGEIDIIASKEDVINFIEVKTRSNVKYGTPAEAVNYDKQRRYREGAIYYLLTNNLSQTDTQISFGIIEILGDEINFIENAF